VPTLIMTGDEDDPCLEPGIFMKRKIPTAGLVVLPKSGHTINLEEPSVQPRRARLPHGGRRRDVDAAQSRLPDGLGRPPRETR